MADVRNLVWKLRRMLSRRHCRMDREEKRWLRYWMSITRVISHEFVLYAARCISIGEDVYSAQMNAAAAQF
jgi:hypothetical protein